MRKARTRRAGGRWSDARRWRRHQRRTTPPSNPRRRAAAVLGAVLVVLAVSACAPPPEPPPGWAQVFITRDGADVTQVRSAGSLAIRASGVPTNTGSNSRSVLWQRDDAASSDQQSCATSAQSRHSVQEGVALRIAPSKRGDRSGTRAITVTKNVWAGAHHIYNVHLWDNTPAPTPTGLAGFALVDSADMSKALEGPGQRRLCARVTGRLLELKVWTDGTAEPQWGDPLHTHRTRVPAGWVYDGRPGVYIGHLEGHDWAQLSAIETGHPGS